MLCGGLLALAMMIALVIVVAKDLYNAFEAVMSVVVSSKIVGALLLAIGWVSSLLLSVAISLGVILGSIYGVTLLGRRLLDEMEAIGKKLGQLATSMSEEAADAAVDAVLLAVLAGLIGVLAFVA